MEYQCLKYGLDINLHSSISNNTHFSSGIYFVATGFSCSRCCLYRRCTTCHTQSAPLKVIAGDNTETCWANSEVTWPSSHSGMVASTMTCILYLKNGQTWLSQTHLCCNMDGFRSHHLTGKKIKNTQILFCTAETSFLPLRKS